MTQDRTVKALADRDQIIHALGGDDPEWLSAALKAVEQVALHQPTLTTNDLWPLVTFPAGLAGGRSMGRVVRWALAEGIIEKARNGPFLLCLAHASLDPVSSQDGVPINHQGPLSLYRSRRFDPAGAADESRR